MHCSTVTDVDKQNVADKAVLAVIPVLIILLIFVLVIVYRIEKRKPLIYKNS